VERPPAAPAAPAGETRKARAIRTVLPVYPSMARSQGVGGVVTVEVTVGVDGSVEDAEVTQSPSPLLNAAAVDAAKKMKFEPALSNGAPIRARVTVPFNFALKK
jgi:TonB family protein